jgi:branched-chain amino acid transport system permease protein
MAEAVRLQKKRVQLPIVDGLLWLIRIAAIAAVVWGSWVSISSGRLTGQQWRNLIVFGVSQGSVYALIALGYTMVYGVLRFINFAHGEVFMLGGMTAYFITDGLARTGLWLSQPWLSLFIALVAAMTVSTLVAVGLERVAYRPLRGKPRLIPFITAIGASFFLQYATGGLFGIDFKSLPNTEVLAGSVRFAGIQVVKPQLVVIITAILMMIGLYVLVEKTRAGRAMRAVAEDAETAALMGVNVDRTISLVFAVGGAMAGAAGMLFAVVFGQIFFFSGFIPGIKAFTAAVLGGIGNIPGAMVGGLTLGLVESLGPSLVLTGLGVRAAHQLKDMFAFLVLVMVLIFRPTGILGERLAEERT